MKKVPLYDDRGQNGENGNSKPFFPNFQQTMVVQENMGTTKFGRYQPTKGHKAILVLALIADCALLVLAFGALFVGIFLNTYRGSYADLCSNNKWLVAAGCMLGVGSLLLIFVIIAFIATCIKSSRLLGFYLLMLIFLFLGEMAVGIYGFARRGKVEKRFSACMKDAYQRKYMDPSFPHVTKAWDTFQERFDCCGVGDSLDYLGNSHANQFAPLSCGGTKADAVGRQPCFKVLKQKVLDNFYIIGGAAFGIAVIQIVALILNALLLRIFHKREEYE